MKNRDCRKRPSLRSLESNRAWARGWLFPDFFSVETQARQLANCPQSSELSYFAPESSEHRSRDLLLPSSVFAATRDRTRRSALALASCDGTADENPRAVSLLPLAFRRLRLDTTELRPSCTFNSHRISAYRIGIYGIIHNIRSQPNPWCTIKAATGGNIHRTNATVSRPRQRELLSVSWVIPRGRTSGKKIGTDPGAISQLGAGCGASDLLPFFVLKERLQSSSLWAPVGGGVVG